MSRRFQFSLKWLFVATTVVAISAALWPRKTDSLENIVDSYNRSIYAHRYDDAEMSAARAQHLYANEIPTKQMVDQCKLMRRMGLMNRKQ